ncbi:Dabb family protein [Microbacterium deminutum]|uniref:Dabb family protein n=1 Tax=Microbacterium deminutum TaxID=344164 RepID=UPI003CD08F94
MWACHRRPRLSPTALASNRCERRACRGARKRRERDRGHDRDRPRTRRDRLPRIRGILDIPLTIIGAIRWKPEVSRAALEDLADMAGTFSGTNPGVLAVHCGPSTSPEGLEGGFEQALIVNFASSSARDDYLPHPAHQPVAQLISRWAEEVVVFDVDA